MTTEDWLDLQCHPSIRPGPVLAIQVSVRRSANGELQMTFRLDGDISRIRIPSPAVPRIGTELWRHTCFEAFIAVEGHPAYHEFNFAPSGEWAVYAFSGYRNGGPVANETTQPQIAVRSTGNRLELDGLVRLDSFLPSIRVPRCVLGSRRLSRRAMDSRIGRFAIRPTNRIFMTPMDSPCCLSRPYPTSSSPGGLSRPRNPTPAKIRPRNRPPDSVERAC